MRFFNHSRFRKGNRVSPILSEVCTAQMLQVIKINIGAGTRPRYVNHVRYGGFLVRFGNVLNNHNLIALLLARGLS
jgi:hypothetical protein